MISFFAKKILLCLKPAKILVFSGFFLLVCFIIISLLINIKVNKANAQDSPDAIAIRVLPNPSHYSALRWYTEKGFEGSPQSLVVDGYDAVRDGRTVYVNAVNVAASNLFTNIYLISYNQEAERMTVDIFGRILTHWKFNSNISTIGTCKDDNTIFCTLDDDCPVGDMCMSIKSRIIRDVRRLADLAEITILLNDFNDQNGNYPLLGVGTYLPNRVLSVWPSWQETFSNDIGSSLPVDPVNAIGSCAGFNPLTCWNEANKTFAQTLPNIPANSLIYEYITDESGNNYDLCSIFESGLTMTGAVYADPAFCPDICLDNDGDGYGFPGSVLCSAGSPLSDCDDNNDSVHIGSAEICTGGADEDCDGLTDCTDADCASLPICALAGFCNNNGTCEPGLGETCSSCPADFCCAPPPCGDGFCDQLGGECATCYGPGLDCRCGNGDIECTEGCDDGNIVSGDGCSDVCAIEAGACTDVDGDLFIVETTAVGVCGSVCGSLHDQVCSGNNDCDDTPATGFPIHPGATEICNGIDDDCNGATPDGFGEIAPLNSSQSGVCVGSFQTCSGAIGWVDDYAGVAGYAMPEAPCDGVDDNDCDGIPDATDPDCTGVCNDTDETDHMGASVGCYQCNNTSDDDGNQVFPLFPTTEADWIAAGFGNMIDPCDPACGPGLSVIDFDNYENGGEVSCDGLDNDCNGIMDDASAPPCLLQAGVCAGSTQLCGGAAGWQLCTAVEYGASYETTETLCDGLDNDCDTNVDEGCLCIDGSSQPCGSSVGVCTMGIEICSGGGLGSVCWRNFFDDRNL